MAYKLVEPLQNDPALRLRAAPPPLGLRSRAPLRWFLQFIHFLEILLIFLPFRVLLYVLLPSWTRPHPNLSLKRSLLIALARKSGTQKLSLGLRSDVVDKTVLPRIDPKHQATPVWIQPVNRQAGLTGEIGSMFQAGGCTTARIPSYWLGKNHNGERSRKAGEDEKVILFFHGGGYRSYNGTPSSLPTKNVLLLLEGCKKAASRNNKNAPHRALSVEYRLTNEVSFPAIVADAVAAWQYLVKEKHFSPKNIIIAGDSAGGNLTLALARYIRDERPLHQELGFPENGPIANGLVLLSPWADISLSCCEAGPSSSGVKNSRSDYLSLDMLRIASPEIVSGLPVPALYSKWISPVCTARNIEDDLFHGFPKALITSG